MSGFIIKVETPRMGGGSPHIQFYIAVGKTSADAFTALGKVLEIPPDQMVDFHPLPDTVVEFMGLSDGEVTQWAPL